MGVFLKRRTFRRRSSVRRRGVAALGRLVGGDVETFFGRYWERRPLLVARKKRKLLPFELTFSAAELLEIWKRSGKNTLVMREQTPVTEVSYAAYLDGCSVIVNHAEVASFEIGKFCRSLRSTCPHAFGQLYATPPLGQAVGPHADDRDVFVVQLVGEKTWTVYRERPVRFPETHEQVGKTMPFPENFLDTCPSDTYLLKEGDVLYVPRGFVHEAETLQEASVHLTVALATQNWTYEKLLPPSKSRHSCDFALLRPALRSTKGRQRAMANFKNAVEGRPSLQDYHDLRRTFHDAVKHQNAHQDLAIAQLAAAKNNKAPRFVVRRETTPQENRALVAREALAEALPRALSAITAEERTAIDELPDAPGFDIISKYAFAHACVDIGLLDFA